MSANLPSADVALDAALRSVVEGAGPRGVTLDEVWGAAHLVEPELVWQADRRQRLAAALNRLEAAGTITFSTRASSQDRSGVPPLPKRVRSTQETATTPQAARPAVKETWRPELSGARDLDRLRPDEFEVLNRVNDWLRDLADDEPVRPLRERSWQIFGDEKRLDQVVRQRLFREGVLTLDLLRTVQIHPPFVYERIADHGAAFVCENHQTFHSAHLALRDDPRGFAVVGYGAGRQFQASVSYVADLGVTGSVVYFGDLDADGLAIARGAADEAETLGLPPVVPSATLYRALLDSQVTASARPIDAAAPTLVSWLPVELRSEAERLLRNGRRIPQECVGRHEIDRLLRRTGDSL